MQLKGPALRSESEPAESTTRRESFPPSPGFREGYKRSYIDPGLRTSVGRFHPLGTSDPAGDSLLKHYLCSECFYHLPSRRLAL